MKEISNYVQKAFESISNSQRKSEMMQEIEQRLEDSAKVWMEHGKEREDAINKAIVDFGDLSEIIQELRDEDLGQGKAADKTILWFSIIGSLCIIALIVFINLYYTPKYIWFIYPTFAVIWWPLSIFFFGRWRKAGK